MWLCPCLANRPTCGTLASQRTFANTAILMPYRLPSEETPECFICTDTTPAPRKSACLCKNRHVHDACLVKMLNIVEHAKCPVCAESYTNVACTSVVVRINCASRGGCACAAVLGASGLLLCATHTFLVVYKHRSTLSQPAQWVLCGLGVFMFAVAVSVLVFLVHKIRVLGLGALLKSAIVRNLRVSMFETPVCTVPVEIVLTEPLDHLNDVPAKRT